MNETADLMARVNEETLPAPKLRLVTGRRGPPTIDLNGSGGNVFSVIANVWVLLKRANQPRKANEFKERAFKAGSYEEVLALVSEYVELT